MRISSDPQGPLINHRARYRNATKVNRRGIQMAVKIIKRLPEYETSIVGGKVDGSTILPD